MTTLPHPRARRYRSIWISDVHLGFPGCQADLLLEFLRAIECETLYLVGDIIDLWYMRRRLYWPQAHNDVIRALLSKARRGTRVVYVPGNHDELLRDHCGTAFGNVRIADTLVHTTASGRRFLVLHGDQFDSVVQCSRLLAVAGNVAYSGLLKLNLVVNYCRRRLGFPHWSLAGFLKHRVKNAVQYISNFGDAVAHAALERELDGVICGHIHRAEISEIHGVTYCNCGDWVESCTALAEHPDGTIELLRWSEASQAVERASSAAA
ncbi:MAG: UDP-2,3-diacylglucosamine diphosphatase [Nitrococcus sp.]|nr:UDP-2,3-diacylglucosamine diphosphatase [Nitrococcus sp.]